MTPVVMWSSVLLLIVTFAALGLLLGFAAVYDTNQQGQMSTATVQENVTANATQGSPPSGAVTDKESG